MVRGRRAIPAAWVQIKVEGIPNRLLAASQRTAQAKFFDRVPVNLGQAVAIAPTRETENVKGSITPFGLLLVSRVDARGILLRVQGL